MTVGAVGIYILNRVDSLIDRLALRLRYSRLAPAKAARDRFIDRRERSFRMRGAAPSEAGAKLISSGILILEPNTGQSPIRGRTVFDRMIMSLARGWRWGDRTNLLETEDIIRMEPDLYLAGFSDELLDLAETYLGQSCSYLACSMEREEPHGSCAGVRRWHTDIEDNRMVRVLVYLNDVTAKNGPFEYLSADRTREAIAKLGYKGGYVPDDAFVAAVSPWDTRMAVGKAGTAVVFDGTRIMHRASAPVDSPRYSVSFTYTTRHPLHVFRATKLSRTTHRRLRAGLGARARDALPRPRRLPW